ncbi:MAG: M48 family metallopeptidase [Clostridia bacterium]|nr:M48 family metallopeptidase [Clostridia bacterium]
MEYEIIRSKRRTICLQVKRDGKVVVRAPLKMSEKLINDFIFKHLDWIKKKQELVKNAHIPEDFDENEVKELKERAREIIEPVLEYYSKKMDVSYERFSINSAKTRFGSCSSKKTLNFSYRLALYPYEAIEYVCVHELAHLKEMNHSKKFWQIVEGELPDYKVRKQLLKRG